MFSETHAGGAFRMVREATKHLADPPAIYGHNAGIGIKTRSIYREVIDLLARLDGIDFRQTAPVRPGPPFLRPYGEEWHASEDALTRPIEGIRPTMITRAGTLDQGNLILNLQDVERRGIAQDVLFLAGSAINSIKDASGQADPKLGLEALLQTIEVHQLGRIRRRADGRTPRRPRGPGPPEELQGPQRGPPPALSRYGDMTKDDRLLRIGVLGCGPIAQFAHFDACRKARNATLHAICDVADDLRERMAAVHRPHVAYRDYDAMLADPEVEAVIVAIANHFHVPGLSEGHRGGQACVGREATKHLAGVCL